MFSRRNNIKFIILIPAGFTIRRPMVKFLGILGIPGTNRKTFQAII